MFYLCYFHFLYSWQQKHYQFLIFKRKRKCVILPVKVKMFSKNICIWVVLYNLQKKLPYLFFFFNFIAGKIEISFEIRSAQLTFILRPCFRKQLTFLFSYIYWKIINILLFVSIKTFKGQNLYNRLLIRIRQRNCDLFVFSLSYYHGKRWTNMLSWNLWMNGRSGSEQ